MPAVLSDSTCGVSTSPYILAVPALGTMSPVNMSIKVDLPAPLWPSNTRIYIDSHPPPPATDDDQNTIHYKLYVYKGDGGMSCLFIIWIDR